MSYDVNVFVRGASPDVVVGLLRSHFGVHVSTADAPSGVATAEVFGIRIAVIATHDLEDDRGIAFSHYPLQIEFTLYAGRMDPKAGRDLCESMARALARAIRAKADAEVLLVEGVQRMIEP